MEAMKDAIIGLCDGHCTHGECKSCDDFRVVYARAHANQARCPDCHAILGKNAVSCESCWTFCMGDEAKEELEQ